ncbi:glycine zipper 2TM domain-containing protein [Alkalisalibacterium limincola]|uniref:Glycine zipper 2TM domain-containing protein n=1 Tax=Alkalisalibacterium limincola TaxID=2699169 RepID=A0A5C8KZS4_9GAMM|nr:glycine zipper 2TM domain-containing protein [Alkalisalibacterium limincola]TXK65641.1 glycine zipper 2TM domain-containing protein [Alkalisalibacterium limincola]
MKYRLILIALASLFLAACATGPTGGYGGPGYSQGGYHGGGQVRCNNCGTVEDIRETYGDGRTSGGGAVLGGVVGAVAGNQVGGGSGRTAATVAGAAAGAMVGNTVERNRNQAPTYDIYVRMDDGRRVVINQRDLGAIRVGSYVETTATGNLRLR